MSTWVLILSLYGTHGPSLLSVTGFTSATACAKAAKFWLSNQNSDVVPPKAICVEVK